MFASLKTHAQILGRCALPARLHGLVVCGVGVLLATQLTACGQKGPLFLPPGQVAPATVAPAPAAASSSPQAGQAPAAKPSLPATAP